MIGQFFNDTEKLK